MATLMCRALGWRKVAIAMLMMSAGTVGVTAAHADPTGAQSDLTAVTGQGAGKVVVSPNHSLQGTFDARVKVNIHGAAPNTTFTITRAIDIPSDGVCTSGDYGAVATLTASAGGAGAVEFERNGGPPGLSSFDLSLRVVGDDGSILQSQCMVITVK
jgi:hypothetical protein